MSSASGHIRSMNSGSKFIADFAVDDLQYCFIGTLAPSVGDFSGSATLEYIHEGSLDGSREVSGKLTGSNLSFLVSNGPKIKANAGTPDGQTVEVTGSGNWLVN